MKDCPGCGNPVRLGAQRIRVNRKHGVYHHIAHLGHGSPPCVPGEWSTVMLKPYPKREEDRPRFQMVQRWEALERRADAEGQPETETVATAVRLVPQKS